jgi:hypothetical protein
MKKYLLYSIFAVLVTIAGCTQFEEEVSVPFTAGPDVAIAITAVTDNSISFTLSPGSGAGFYSYLVTAGDAPAELETDKVLKCSYDGVKKGTVNYANSPTATILVEGLAPFTVYQIYAIAANGSGMVGKIANASQQTEDVNFTVAAILGTYNIEMTSYWDGPLTDPGINIVDDPNESDENFVLINDLLLSNSSAKAEFDPLARTITIEPQVFAASVNFGTSGIHDLLILNADDDSLPVILNVPAVGTITSPANYWGYYIDGLDGWYDVFTESTWTRQ